MPMDVLGADGRVIKTNTDEADAKDTARNVHAATGEVVTLVPYVFDGENWVPDADQATAHGAEPGDAPQETETTESTAAPDESWSVADLKKYAADHGIAFKSKDTKPTLLAAIKAAS